LFALTRRTASRTARLTSYETDFDPGHTPERTPNADARLAAAVEYAAFQLGQINRKLDSLTAAVERLAGSQPDPRPFSQIKAEREAKKKA
jgi:hypothetical protein